MRVVWTRAGAALIRRWGLVLATILLVTAASATILTLASGARRTATAPDRLTELAGGDDSGLVTQQFGAPRTAEIASLPAVQQAIGLTFATLGLDATPFVDDAADLNTFAATDLFPTMRLVEGSTIDPTHPHDFVANRSFVEEFRAEIGDRFEAAALSRAQMEVFDVESEPKGARFEAQLVGVIDSPDDLDDPTPTIIFPSTLLEEDIGVATTLVGVFLEAGSTRADLRAQLDALPDGSSFGLEEAPIVSASVRSAVDAQAKALWAITGVAAVAAVAAIGQLLVRQARQSRIERQTLVALGFTRAQVDSESLSIAAVPVVAGAALGALVAGASAGLFPRGFVRHVEPDLGSHPNVALLGFGAVLIAVALLGWVTVAMLVARRPTRAARASRTVDTLAARAPSTASRIGVRFGLARHERDTMSVLGTSLGLIIAVVGTVGAATFATSIRTLTGDGARFGSNYDLMYGNGWYPANVDLRAALDDEPALDALMLLGVAFARDGDETVELVGFDTVRGGLQPTILRGRLPVSNDEVTLGRLTAAQLGASIGDEIQLDTESTSTDVRVVGIGVIPSLGINAGLGKGAIVTIDGLRTIAPDAGEQAAAVRFNSAAKNDLAATSERLAATTGMSPTGQVVPPPIRNLARIENIPLVLAGLLATLGVLTLVQTLVTSVRARRRDFAVLRAMGADKRHLGRVVRWQATAVAAVPLVVGVPLGIVLGRLVFRTFAERTGAVPDPSNALLFTALVAAGLLLVANGTAIASASLGGRARAARVLRTE